MSYHQISEALTRVRHVHERREAYHVGSKGGNTWREAEYKKQADANPHKRGPKPKEKRKVKPSVSSGPQLFS